MFGRATITLGIGPHSSSTTFSFFLIRFLSQSQSRSPMDPFGIIGVRFLQAGCLSSPTNNAKAIKGTQVLTTSRKNQPQNLILSCYHESREKGYCILNARSLTSVRGTQTVIVIMTKKSLKATELIP